MTFNLNVVIRFLLPLFANADGCDSSLDEDSEAIIENYRVLGNGHCYTIRLYIIHVVLIIIL